MRDFIIKNLIAHGINIRAKKRAMGQEENECKREVVSQFIADPGRRKK